MADKVYPASKPAPPPPRPPPGAAANGGGVRPAAPPSFPPTKSQLHRPTYRPQPPPKHRPPRRRRSSCCCACFLWTTLLLLAIFLAAIAAAAAVYFVYDPHQPAFTVSSLRLTALNVSSTGLLTSALDLSVTARNPNQELAFLYSSSDITVTSSNATIATGTFPSFTHSPKNTTILKTTLSAKNVILDESTAADLRRNSTIPMRIDVETRAGVQVGAAGVKTSKIVIRVRCEEVSVKAPKGKGKVATAAAPDARYKVKIWSWLFPPPEARCKVKLRVKIWRWWIDFA